MTSLGIKILAIQVMFTTKPRTASPLLDVSVANGNDGYPASKECFIRPQM